MATTVADLVAQLRADTAQFDAALAGAQGKLAGLSAAGAKASGGLSQSFTRVGQSLESVGKKFTTAGRHLTTSVTLPLAGIGYVATKAALNFNTAFAKIDALAGNIGTSMDNAKKHVQDLAAATGQAPQDLADSLYFIASAGLKANKVMDTLDITAKAAATGMGSADQIAQTLTSTLNAYAGTGLDAGKAMDIFTEAVKLGKAETSDFAEGLGPIIGVAANAGVSLQELTGAIAQATNLGIPFDRAVTGLRFTIQSLESPTSTAGKLLNDFGINAGDLAAMVADPNVGLTGTLQYLYNTLNDGSEAGRKAWSAITGGARSSIVAVDLVGKHQNQTNSIIKQMGDAANSSASEFNTAYQRIQQTPAFKFQQALAELKNAAIDLGNTLIPILLHDVIPAIQSVIRWFSNLSDSTKSLMVKFAIAAAVGGPLLSFVGGILRIGGAVAKAIGWLGSLAKAATATGEAVAAANIGGGLSGAAGGIASAGYKIAPGFTGGGAIAAEEGGGLLATLGGGSALAGLGTATGIGALIAGGGLAITKTIDNITTSTGDLASEFGVADSRVKDIQTQINNGASWIGLGSATDKAKEALSRYNTVLDEAHKAGIPQWEITLKMNEAWGEAVHQIGGITGSLDQFQRVLEERLGIANTTTEVKQLTDAFSNLTRTAGRQGQINALAAGSRTGGEAPTQAQQQTAAFNHLVQVMRIAKANGTDVAKALGPAMAHALKYGTISIDQYRLAFAEAGVKIPYAAAQQQGFQQSLITTTNLTDKQKGSLSNLFGAFSTLGIHVDSGIKSFAHAGIAAGDYTGVLNVLLRDVKGQALKSFDELSGSIDKQTRAQIQAAIKGHDWLRVLILEAKAQKDLSDTQDKYAKVEADVRTQFAQAKGVLDQHAKALIQNAIDAGHFQKAQELLNKALGDGSKATSLSEKAILGNVDASKKQKDILDALTGALPKNTDMLKKNIQNLIDQAGKADTAKEKIDLLREALNKMEGNYNFTIDADTNPANRQLLDLLNSMQKKGFTLDPHVVSGHYTGPRHSGGMVGEGSMPMPKDMMKRPDERLVVALRDEMVMSPAATRQYRAELEAMNAGTRHNGGIIDQAVTQNVKAVEGTLQKPPIVLAQVAFTPEMIRGLSQEFAMSNVILQAAKSQLGVPYKWGASNPEGTAGGPGAAFDCSGLTMWAAAQAGLSLVHHAATQWLQLPHTNNPQPGDFAFFGNPIHHVGIVADRPHQMIDAPHTGAVVRYDPIYGDLHGYGSTSQVLARHAGTSGSAHAGSGNNVGGQGRAGHSDDGAFFTKRTPTWMMPGEVALAPNSTRSISALSQAIGKAARLHEGGVVDAAVLESNRHGGGHNDNGDGFHFGKYRKLLQLEKADHIDAIIKHVKNLYADNHQKFPFDYVMKTLNHVTNKELHKVAPSRDSLRDFVRHLAENIESWAGRGHGHGGGGDGGGDGHGQGGHLGGLFGKVFSGFMDTLAKATTPQLAQQFMSALQKEYKSRKGLDVGELTRVIDAMFQQVPAENYLNALETKWENAVPGKTVSLLDKKGRNFSVTAAILKMLGAHQGAGGGDGSGGGDGGKGPLAFHLGKYRKLLGMEHKYDHPKEIDKVVQKVQDEYKKQGHLPYDYMKQTLSAIGLKDLHKVAPNSKNLLDFLHKLNDGIDHSPGGHDSGHTGHHGGGHGGDGHQSREEKLLKDHHHWERVGAAQAKQLARWMLQRDPLNHRPGNFNNLDYIIMRESGWHWNAGSLAHAYGIPQSLPAQKMRTAGADWRTNAQTQEEWMFKYIRSVYGSIAAALRHKKATNWYGTGLDAVFSQPTTIGVGERGAERVKVTPLGQNMDDMKIQLRVDRKRFNRDMDFDYITSGR